MSELEKYLRIRRLTDIYYDIQDVRIRTASRLRVFPIKSETGYPDEILKIEKQTKKEIENHLESVPIYVQWLKEVKGIGPCLSGGLIGIIMVKFSLKDSLGGCSEVQKRFALKTKDKKFRVPEIRGISAFANVSKLWRFSGLDVVDGHAPRRRRGEHVTWSPKMRTLCWKIGESFVKVGDFYRTQYEEFRRMEDERNFICEVCKKNHPKAKQCIKGHRYARAKRKTVKMFLAHLFDRWYRLEGLTPPKPYAQKFLGHDSYVPPPI